MAHFDVSKVYETFKKHFEFFIGSETFSIVSCPIGDTSPQDFSIMTLARSRQIEEERAEKAHNKKQQE